VEERRRAQITDERAKLILYGAFVDGKLEASRTLLSEVHRLYFQPEHEEFSPRTMWSPSNAGHITCGLLAAKYRSVFGCSALDDKDRMYPVLPSPSTTVTYHFTNSDFHMGEPCPRDSASSVQKKKILKAARPARRATLSVKVAHIAE
jgi:hypothetical protein